MLFNIKGGFKIKSKLNKVNVPIKNACTFEIKNVPPYKFIKGLNKGLNLVFQKSCVSSNNSKSFEVKFLLFKLILSSD